MSASPERPVRTELAASPGVTMVADVLGPEDGPTVLLLHGGGQTRHSWGGAAANLARDGWRTVTADLRGHGDSTWSPDGVYHLEKFAEDVRIVARRLNRPVLVGASLGGLASLLAIGESDDDFASALVLVDITPRREHKGSKRINDFMQLGVEGFDSLEDAADAVASYLPHRERPSDVSGLRKNLRLRDDGKFVWHWDPKFFHRIEPDADEPTANHIFPKVRLDAAARRIRVPTLLVRGGESDIVSDEGVKELRELIPHADVTDVAGAGHMVAGDKNDRFTAAVADFLDALRPQMTGSRSSGG